MFTPESENGRRDRFLALDFTRGGMLPACTDRQRRRSRTYVVERESLPKM